MSMWWCCNLINIETIIYQYSIFTQSLVTMVEGHSLAVHRYAEVAGNKVGIHINY